jgi:hypothetical protein
MAIATKNGAPIIKDGKLATSCGCCGGWHCCPSVYTVTVQYNVPDFETLARQGVCFITGGNAWARLRIASSQLNAISSAAYKALGGKKIGCGFYTYLLPQIGGSLSNGPVLSGEPLVDVIEFDVRNGQLLLFRVVLPSQFTQLSTDVRCFSCEYQWIPGPEWANTAFSTLDYAQPFTQQGTDFYQPITNTRFLPEAMAFGGDTNNIQTQHTPPEQYQWIMDFYAVDPLGTCVGLGPPHGRRKVGDITVTATAGCS